MSPEEKRSLTRFIADESTSPWNRRNDHGNVIRTRENRTEWQRESDRLSNWVLNLHPAMQKKLTLFIVRCPTRGCLLGRVYKLPIPERKGGGVRYLWIGATWANVAKAAIINWAWDGYRGAKEFVHTGCVHGRGLIDIGMLYEMVEALDLWRPDEKRPEDWLTHYCEPVQKGYRRRTIVADTPWWEPWE